jgi:tetratricopeptide (TPR) repeat protein
MLGMHDDAVRLAGRARAEAERARDGVTLGRTHYVLATTAFSIGPASECVAHARRAIALLEPTVERAALGLAWWVCALGHHMLGEFAAALDAVARVWGIAGAIGDRGLDSLGGIAAAWTHLALGDSAAAMAAGERAVASAFDRYIESRARGVFGYTRVIGAADPAGLTLIREALERIPRRDNTSAILWVFLSDAYARFGDSANARKAADDGLAAAREARFAWGIAAAHRARGRVAAAGGDVAEARSAFGGALEGFRAVEAGFDVALTSRDLAALPPRAPSP